jgi:hypothetical protein
MPLGRNQDGLFGATLGQVDPDALLAYIPVGVVHDSPRSPTYDLELASARRTRLADILAEFSSSCSVPSGLRPDSALRLLGQHLRSSAATERQAFAVSVRHAVVAERTRRLLKAADHVRRLVLCPPHWRSVLDAYQQEVLEHLGDESVFVPIEATTAAWSDASVDETRALISHVGILYEQWPDVLEVAERHAGDIAPAVESPE